MNSLQARMVFVAGLFLSYASAAQATEFYCYGTSRENEFITNLISYTGFSDLEVERNEAAPIVAEEYRKKFGAPPAGVRCVSSKFGAFNVRDLHAKSMQRHAGPILDLDFNKIDSTVLVCTTRYGESYGPTDYYVSKMRRQKTPQPPNNYLNAYIAHMKKTVPTMDIKRMYGQCESFASEALATASIDKVKARDRYRYIAHDWTPVLSTETDILPVPSGGKVEAGSLTITGTSGGSANQGKDAAGVDNAKRGADNAAAKASAEQAALAAKKKREEKLIKCHGSLEAAKRAKTSCQ